MNELEQWEWAGDVDVEENADVAPCNILFVGRLECLARLCCFTVGTSDGNENENENGIGKQMKHLGWSGQPNIYVLTTNKWSENDNKKIMGANQLDALKLGMKRRRANEKTEKTW